jgi:hypothetical protein
MIRLWPVIHLSSLDLALENARRAVAARAHGVFLIHMDGQDDQVDAAAVMLRQALPQLRVGANFLSLPADEAMARAVRLGLAASWSDSPGIHGDHASELAQRLAARRLATPEHLHFAGVAFKYQAKEPSPADAAVRAWAMGLIPTTSGAATGRAPPAEKLAGMRQALGEHARLACASGITPENAATLAPYLTDVLVATGISEDFYTLCPQRMAQLQQVLEA